MTSVMSRFAMHLTRWFACLAAFACSVAASGQEDVTELEEQAFRRRTASRAGRRAD